MQPRAISRKVPRKRHATTECVRTHALVLEELDVVLDHQPAQRRRLRDRPEHADRVGPQVRGVRLEVLRPAPERVQRAAAARSHRERRPGKHTRREACV